VSVDVLDRGRTVEIRQAGLEPERGDGSADEAGFAVGTPLRYGPVTSPR
jgi:hypothetical protein